MFFPDKDIDDLDPEIPVAELEGLPPSSWKMRKCELYKREHKDCRSIKERFHQYFIFGEFSDCSQWKEDYNSCMKYRKTKDIQALENCITSESNRKKERLAGHEANDIWEKRESIPPPNWNCKLLDVNIRNKEKFPSYIKAMQKEAAEGKTNSNSWCVIS